MVILLIKAQDLIQARTISSQELVLSSFCLQRLLTEREHKPAATVARAHQKIVSETVRSLLSLDLYLRRLFLLQAKDALISLSLDLGKGISSKPFSAVHAFRSRRSSILGLGYLVILSPHMSHQHQ